MHKAYFKSLFSRYRQLLFVYALICFCCVPLGSLLTRVDRADGYVGLGTMALVIFGIFMLILGFVLPLVSFRFNLNKKSVDTVYSLPISRKELYNTHYFAGLIMIVAIPTICFLIDIFIITLRFERVPMVFNLRMLLNYVAMLLAVTSLYSLNTWIVNKANNLVDALILEAAYEAIPLILMLATMVFIPAHIVGMAGFDLIDLSIYKWISPSIMIFTPLSNFEMYLYSGTVNTTIFLEMLCSIISCVFFYLVALFTFNKREGEDAQQVSRDFFTYPFVVNIVSIALISTSNVIQMDILPIIVYLVITFTLFMLMHFVSERSTKIKKVHIIKFILILLAFNIFNYASKQTYFFGINQRKVDYSKFDQLTIDSSVFYYDFNSHDVVTIDLKNMDEIDQELIESLLNLQGIAAERFRQGEYDEFNYDGRTNEYVNLSFRNYDNNEQEQRYYSLSREDFKEVLSNERFIKLLKELG